MSGPMRPHAANLLAWGFDGMEAGTIEQALKTSRLPFVEGHVALMPDAHIGFGSTIGSVIPTHGAIIPSAIGVDIGCGMIAGRLVVDGERLLTVDDLGNLDALHNLIASVVPAGVGQGHSRAQGLGDLGLPVLVSDSQKLTSKASKQFGTLGSGNHFVEVSIDEFGFAWVVLHSGSRGVGNELAKIHIEGAKALMKRYFIELEDPDLAYLVEGTPEFAHYISDMRWAQNYAAANREQMLANVINAVGDHIGEETLSWETRVNCHHNYTEQEHHGGKNPWVTRKGAIRARVGDLGVIPGSMGTSTFIVRGLGNKASYDSAAHGAGRRMSRGQARRELDTQALWRQMDGKAWNEDIKLIDEDPRAYKDIHSVMAAQADLVMPIYQLEAVLNYKGN